MLSLVPAAPTGVDWSEGDDEFSLARAPRGREEAAEFTAALSRALSAAGERCVGYKVGGTDAAPFFGHLFSRHVVQPSDLPARLGFSPRGVELELVAELKADLPPRAGDEPYSASDVAGAVRRWRGALEYCGTRLAGPLKAPSWLRVADGAQLGALVWASDRRAYMAEGADDSLRDVVVNLRVNGEVVAKGVGADARVRGSPLDALTWLVNEVNAKGLPHLSAGDVITTGTLCGLTAVKDGDVIDAEWAPRLGTDPFATLHFKVSQARE